VHDHEIYVTFRLGKPGILNALAFGTENETILLYEAFKLRAVGSAVGIATG
jgi:hypothetical protein